MPIGPERSWQLSFQRLAGKYAPYFPLLAAGLSVFVWMSPLLLGGKAFFWGTPALQFVPWWSYAFQMVLDGHLPLWNSEVGMGAPLLANYQTALFYPPTWFLAIFYALGDSAWLAWGLAPLLGVHLIFSAWGMALLLRRLGGGVFGQSVGALVWAMCSYLVARVNFPSILFSAAWLPWILLLLTPEKGKPFFARGRFLRLAFSLALLLLSGHAQTAWYILLISGAWSAYWAIQAGFHPDDYPAQDESAWQERGERLAGLKRLVKTWLWLGSALLLAVGIASVQLIPTAEYLLQSQRAEAVDFDLALSYSLWPWKLATLLAPGLFGSPVQGDYWGYANYWEDALYIGLLPFFLALSFLIKPTDRSKHLNKTDTRQVGKPYTSPNPALKLWIIIGMVVILIWGSGRFTPIFPWFYRHVPTFDLFQAPARVLIGLEFILVLMAGCAASSWRRPQGRSLYWTRLGTAGAFAVSLGAGITWAVLGEVSPSMLRATAMAGGWGVLAGLLSLTAPPGSQAHPGDSGKDNLKRRLWQGAVLTVIALDLLVAGWGLNPGVPLDFYTDAQASTLGSSQSLEGRVYIPRSTEENLKFERFLRFDTFEPAETWSQMREYLLPNLGMLEVVSAVNNFDPFVPARFENWMTHLDGLPEDKLHTRLAWMNAGWTLGADKNSAQQYAWQQVEGGQRLHWVACAQIVNGEGEAWQAVTQGDLDWELWVVIENAQQVGQTVCNPSPGKGQVSLEWLETHNPNHIKVRLNTQVGGYFVLADTWYPGWQARLNGEESTLLRANYLFRAVLIPQGEHILELVYRPISFWLGLAISLLSLAIAGTLFLWGRRK